MKMISEKEEGGKLSSWKVYYAILSNGFLLLYNKETHTKSKVKQTLKKKGGGEGNVMADNRLESKITCGKF